MSIKLRFKCLDPLLYAKVDIGCQPISGQDTLEDSKEQMEQLRISLEADDISVVEHTAHTLKGEAANIGAGPFREFALRIEQTAKAGDLKSVRNMMEEFEKKHRRLNKALEEINWDNLI